MNNKTVLTNRVTVGLLAVFCCLLWGSATPAIKTAYSLFQIAPENTMSRFVLAGVRFFFAGLTIIIFGSVKAGKFLCPDKGNVMSVIKLSLVQTVLQYYFFIPVLRILPV